MPISRSGGCQEVCQEVRSRLEKIGLLAVQEIKHGPVFAALEQCVIVRKEDLQAVLSALTPGEGALIGGHYNRLLEAVK